MSSTLIRHNTLDIVGSGAALNAIVAPTSVNNDNIQAYDVRGFNQIMIHVTGTFTATYRIQFSGDGVNWLNGAFYITNNTGVAGQYTTLSSGTNLLLLAPVQGKYCRIVLSAYTSGTVQVNGLATTNTNAPIVNFAPLAGSSTPIPDTAQGASTFSHTISAASTNATVVKGSAGVVNSITVSNNGASVAYFKLYNKATAPTVGTDTPVATVLVPVNGTVVIPGGPFGMRFSTGIGFALTAGITVADVAAVAANQLAVSVNYT